MPFAEHNLWQYWFHGARDGYRYPESDLPVERFVDRPVPRELHAANWSAHPAANDPIMLPRTLAPRGAQGFGRPVQVGHPTRRVMWSVSGTYGPAFTAAVPAPAMGDYWVEDAPRPMWAKMASSHYDNHVIVTDPAGGWYEMIGATNWGAWRCAAMAQYDRHGEMIRGMPVIAAKRSLLPMLWNRDDLPHLCTITMRGNDHNASDAQHLGKWLVLDSSKVPRPSTEDGGQLWDALTTFGAIYGDHGGRSNLSGVAGHQWAGVDWGGLAFRLTDFLLAT